MIQGFQKEMSQEKTQIERRISIPRNFTVDQHHTIFADQNVFGTEISVHKAFSRGFDTQGLRHKHFLQSGMTRSGGEQVRVQPQLTEVCRGIELLAEHVVNPGSTVDFPYEPSGRFGVTGAAVCIHKQLFPIRESFAEKLHAEIVRFRIRESKLGHSAGHEPSYILKIIPLAHIAADIREPIVLDFEFCQRPFDYELFCAVFYQVDFARDAAVQGREPCAGVADVTVASQNLDKFHRAAHGKATAVRPGLVEKSMLGSNAIGALSNCWGTDIRLHPAP